MMNSQKTTCFHFSGFVKKLVSTLEIVRNSLPHLQHCMVPAFCPQNWAKTAAKNSTSRKLSALPLPLENHTCTDIRCKARGVAPLLGESSADKSNVSLDICGGILNQCQPKNTNILQNTNLSKTKFVANNGEFCLALV